MESPTPLPETLRRLDLEGVEGHPRTQRRPRSLPWWRTPPAVLLTGRKTVLYDAILALTPYCDPDVREAALRAALRSGDDEARAAVTAEAAMILVARERQRTEVIPSRASHCGVSPTPVASTAPPCPGSRIRAACLTQRGRSPWERTSTT